MGLARWMTVDPLWPGQPGYAYASNSPHWRTDPNGLSNVALSPEVIGWIEMILLSLGISLESLAFLALLAALAALWLLSCDVVKRMRYQVCPHDQLSVPPCVDGDSCFTLLYKTAPWAECMAVQLFLSRRCFSFGDGHDNTIFGAGPNLSKCISIARRSESLVTLAGGGTRCRRCRRPKYTWG